MCMPVAFDGPSDETKSKTSFLSKHTSLSCEEKESDELKMKLSDTLTL